MRNYGQWMGGTTRPRTELRGRRDFVPLKRQVGGTRSFRELGQRDVPTVNCPENMFPSTPAAALLSSKALNVVTTMTQTMTCRLWIHQQGPKRRPKRPR
jgi:hypothetical protein